MTNEQPTDPAAIDRAVCEALGWWWDGLAWHIPDDDFHPVDNVTDMQYMGDAPKVSTDLNETFKWVVPAIQKAKYYVDISIYPDYEDCTIWLNKENDVHKSYFDCIYRDNHISPAAALCHAFLRIK